MSCPASGKVACYAMPRKFTPSYVIRSVQVRLMQTIISRNGDEESGWSSAIARLPTLSKCRVGRSAVYGTRERAHRRDFRVVVVLDLRSCGIVVSIYMDLLSGCASELRISAGRCLKYLPHEDIGSLLCFIVRAT